MRHPGWLSLSLEEDAAIVGGWTRQTGDRECERGPRLVTPLFRRLIGQNCFVWA